METLISWTTCILLVIMVFCVYAGILNQKELETSQLTDELGYPAVDLSQ